MRRLPYHKAEEADEQEDNMLKRGVIEKSTSPCAALIVLVKKNMEVFSFVWTIQA